MSTLLTVDPSLTSTGLALWNYRTLIGTELLKVSPREGEHWLSVAQRMTMKFHDVLHVRQPHKVTIELPSFYASSSGHMVAVRGDLIKLACIVGMFTRTAMEPGADVRLVEPNEWKGQLPKDVVIQRVRDRIPEIDKKFAPKKDSWDAIGIGLYEHGLL